MLPGSHDIVGVAVNQQVRAFDLFQQVQGAGAVLNAFVIHAQMREAKHQIRILQLIHGLLSGFHRLIGSGEGDHFDQRGVHLPRRLRRAQPEEAQLQTALGLDGLRGRQNGFARLIQIDVAADHRQL